ncbi:4Fe-4S single cluster domain-containing protein [Sporomusa termitida]|uniref:Anaerobic ribonucleoside-triphosphate reductase-activating protein n=1 Tax=Sporomusa termitida TaxID=2377 RepID=A0A517E0U4_9FIRM|nr:4Fe-4S single cluster domain-containing protein [Sporomusa termitida]QDR83225.1 NrdG: anaerobic ribonucleoside-triphosphate reductase activating protein [Sporomusa termitida]
MNTAGGGLPGGLINMAAFLPASSVNGPGRRAVVWVQGCHRRCPGCFNPEMLALTENQLVTVAELAGRILAAGGIEGVTFSGGEPFRQAAALAELAAIMVKHGLTVIVFTGYEYEELTQADNPDWNKLLQVTDLLVSGPYLEHRPSCSYLRGSANQELVFLSPRLRDHPDINKQAGQAREFIIDAAGNIIITGLG